MVCILEQKLMYLSSTGSRHQPEAPPCFLVHSHTLTHPHRHALTHTPEYTYTHTNTNTSTHTNAEGGCVLLINCFVTSSACAALVKHESPVNNFFLFFSFFFILENKTSIWVVNLCWLQAGGGGGSSDTQQCPESRCLSRLAL